MAGRLTTHVLDIVYGQPAADLALELWQLASSDTGRTLLKTMRTNTDGRTDGPLLNEHELVTGCYEIVFMVGAYFASQERTSKTPAFLDSLPVRFCIADPSEAYHVPLLVSPWAYSTYRGS